MLVSLPVRRRARLALAAAIAFLSGFALLPATPAGAQSVPEPGTALFLDALAELAEADPGRYDSPLHALLRAV